MESEKKDGRMEQCMTMTSVGAWLQKTKELVLAECGLRPLGGSGHHHTHLNLLQPQVRLTT